MQVLMHSYTFRAYPLERAFKKAKEYGYDGLELSTVHFDFFNLKGEVNRIKELCAMFNLPVVTVDFPADFISSEESLEKSVKNLIEAIPLCKSLGARMLNGGVGPLAGEDPSDFAQGGSVIAREEHYERAIEALKALVPHLEKAELYLTLEIHMNTLHDTAGSTKRILDGVKSHFVKANLDPGNMFATPQAENPLQAIDLLGSDIGYLHLKNCRMIGDRYDYSWSLANGDIDFFKVLSHFYGKGYSSDICIEYVGAGDPAPKAKEDIQYLRDILKEII